MSTVVRLAVLVLLATAAARATAAGAADADRKFPFGDAGHAAAEQPSRSIELFVIEAGQPDRSPAADGWALVVPLAAAAEPVSYQDATEKYAVRLDERSHALVTGLAPGAYLVTVLGGFEREDAGAAQITVLVDWAPKPLVVPAQRVEVQPGETVTVRITVRTPKPNIPPEMVPTPPSLGNAGLLASADETAADHPEGPPSPGRTAERTTTRTLGAAGLALGLAGLLLAVAGWTKDARRRTRPRN